MSRQISEPTPLLFSGSGVLSWGLSGQGVEMTAHWRNLGTSRDIPLHTLYVLMAWAGTTSPLHTHARARARTHTLIHTPVYISACIYIYIYIYIYIEYCFKLMNAKLRGCVGQILRTHNHLLQCKYVIAKNKIIAL